MSFTYVTRESSDVNSTLAEPSDAIKRIQLRKLQRDQAANAEAARTQHAEQMKQHAIAQAARIETAALAQSARFKHAEEMRRHAPPGSADAPDSPQMKQAEELLSSFRINCSGLRTELIALTSPPGSPAPAASPLERKTAAEDCKSPGMLQAQELLSKFRADCSALKTEMASSSPLSSPVRSSRPASITSMSP